MIAENGSIINGAFQRADAIDELSLVVAPVTADKEDKPLFMDGKLSDFELLSAESIDGNVVMRYKRRD